MHPGRGPGLTARRLGERGGVEEVTLTESQIPNHTHSMVGSTQNSSTFTAAPNLSLARSIGGNAYSTDTSSLTDINDAALSRTGGSGSHNNLQPFLTLNFIIALVGLYPSRS